MFGHAPGVGCQADALLPRNGGQLLLLAALWGLDEAVGDPQISQMTAVCLEGSDTILKRGGGPHMAQNRQ